MFGLTLQEKRVLLFLIFLVVIGLGIDYFNKIHSSFTFLEDFIQIKEEEIKFNLNQIDKETLVRLPGIGEKLAQRIIDYRQKYGSFRYIEELKKIRGIKSSIYEKIKDYLYVK